jgi:hypothetical protein
MNERRARRTVTRREAGGRRPLTTAAFASITGEPFPLFRLFRRIANREWVTRTPSARLPPCHRSTTVCGSMNSSG